MRDIAARRELLKHANVLVKTNDPTTAVAAAQALLGCMSAVLTEVGSNAMQTPRRRAILLGKGSTSITPE